MDIDKLAWLLVRDRRLLSARTRGRETFYIPGGKREKGESDAEALAREIREELSVDLVAATIEPAGVYRARADGKPEGTFVTMTCFFASFEGPLKAAAEIEEIVWIRSADRERCSPVVKLIVDDFRNKGLID